MGKLLLLSLSVFSGSFLIVSLSLAICSVSFLAVSFPLSFWLLPASFFPQIAYKITSLSDDEGTSHFNSRSLKYLLSAAKYILVCLSSGCRS